VTTPHLAVAVPDPAQTRALEFHPTIRPLKISSKRLFQVCFRQSIPLIPPDAVVKNAQCLEIS
jgi:hypothetical protein